MTHLALNECCFQALESLKTAVALSSASVQEDLKFFTEQCSLSFAQRYLAAQKGAYPTILACCQRAGERKEVLSVALEALSALTDGQPDLLDVDGREFLIGTLDTHKMDPAITCLCIRVVRHCCLKHENNRQDLVKAGVLALLAGSITRHIEHDEVVREACGGLRVMTFDDDVRVPFGNAHEHAKMIVLEHNGLKVIVEAAEGELWKMGHNKIKFCKHKDELLFHATLSAYLTYDVLFIFGTAHPDKTSVLSELCATLSRLAVRNEFCQDIVDMGGLKFMMTLMADSLDCQVSPKRTLGILSS